MNYMEDINQKMLEAHLEDIVTHHQKLGTDYFIVRCGREDISNDLVNFLMQRISPLSSAVIENKSSDWLSVTELPTPEVVIVFLDSLDNLTKNLKTLWNNRKQYRFIVSKVITDYSLIEKACDDIWRLRILNFSISFVYKSSLEVIRYNPFLKRIYKTGRIETLKRKRVNMRGSALAVTLFHYPPRMKKVNDTYSGIDFVLLQGIVEYLNATLVVVEPHIGDAFVWQVVNILYAATEFGFVISFYHPAAANEIVDYVYPWRMDDLVVIVPHSTQIPQYKYIFLIFALSVWISILASLLTVAAVDSLLLHRGVHFQRSLLDSYTILLGQSIERMINGSVSVKTLYVFWFYVCIILSVAFQSSLTGMMITPKYYNELDSIKDLKDYKIDIVVNSNHALRIPEAVYPSSLLIKIDDPTLMSRLLAGAKAAYAIQNTIAEEVAGKTYHLVKEHLVPGLSSYHIATFSPYLDDVNEYLFYDKEFGLNRFQKDSLEIVEEDVSDVTPLSLLHLQTVFYILILGECLSVLFFCGEVVFEKIYRMREMARLNKA